MNMANLAKKTAFAVAVASMCLAGAANATLVDPISGTFGTLTAPGTVAFDGAEATSSATVFDVISFSMSNVAASNTATIVSGLNGWGFASFSTSLWSTASESNSGNELAIGTSVNTSPGAWFSIYSFAPLTPDASPYFIHINGVTLDTSTSAVYSGNMTLAPIPEPETYAMMLAGLGLMGFIARRRQSNTR